MTRTLRVKRTNKTKTLHKLNPQVKSCASKTNQNILNLCCIRIIWKCRSSYKDILKAQSSLFCCHDHFHSSVPSVIFNLLSNTEKHCTTIQVVDEAEKVFYIHLWLGSQKLNSLEKVFLSNKWTTLLCPIYSIHLVFNKLVQKLASTALLGTYYEVCRI